MEEPSPTNPLICLGCGADNPADAVWCRVCHVSLRDEEAAPFVSGKSRFPRPAQERPWTIATFMLVVALVAFALGIWREAPRVAIALLVLIGPAFLITLSSIIVRRRKDRPMDDADIVVRFLVSIVMTVIALSLLAGLGFFYLIYLMSTR